MVARASILETSWGAFDLFVSLSFIYKLCNRYTIFSKLYGMQFEGKFVF